MVTTRKYINKVSRFLRDAVPPAWPVRTRQIAVKDPREFGSCSFVDDGAESHFLIHLRKGMDDDLILFILVHEWAHAVAWTGVRQDYIEDHDAEWGVAYARCWKAVSGCP
jgi:hypothetical protein